MTKRRGLLICVEFEANVGIKSLLWVDKFKLLSAAAAQVDGSLKVKQAEELANEMLGAEMRRQRAVSMAQQSETNSQLTIISEPYMVSALSIIVVGASGDLAKKKTFPALLDLFSHGHLPRHVNIIGVARSELKDDELRERLKPFCMKVNGVDEDLVGKMPCAFACLV